jgi:HK97 family phage prohead protease
MEIEYRAACEFRAVGDSRRLAGYAAKFDALSEDLGGFREKISRGAFARSLRDPKRDPLALLEHDRKIVLGRKSASTLRLHEDSAGLAFEVDVPRTAAGNDVLESVGRGDLKHASFAFRVAPDGERWTIDGDTAIRTITDCDLIEVSLTVLPAYASTEVARRSLEKVSAANPNRLLPVAKFLETCL